MTIIEGKVMCFNGPSLAVNLMEGQSAETADIVPMSKCQLILPHFMSVLKCLWLHSAQFRCTKLVESQLLQ